MKNNFTSEFLATIHECPLEQRIAAVKTLKSHDEWAQSLLLGDEWVNVLTHALGVILSISGFFFLLDSAFFEYNPLKQISYAVYGVSLVALYTASTCYHAVRKPRLKKVFRTVDHCAIYLLIAGSYTPITLLGLDDLWGRGLLAVVWGMAFLGIAMKIFSTHRFKIFSTALYLLMGWMVVIAAEPLVDRLNSSALYWLIGGGVFYTVGVVFYAMDKRRFYHAIWHLFVLCGSICHYIAILFYL